MLTKAMRIHELLAKNLFNVHLKTNDNLAFLDTLDFGSHCGERMIQSSYVM